MTSMDRPPQAARQPLKRERFGVRWVDDYAWLRDPAYPEVKDAAILAYLEAENAYVRAQFLEPAQDFIQTLHQELKGRIKDEDQSVPVRQGAYLYSWAFAAGAQYRTWYRQAGENGTAAIILDENELARDTPYFNLLGFTVSPDGRYLAYTTDSDGSERYRLHVKDLESGDERLDIASDLSGAVVWQEGTRALYAVDLNDKLRPFRVRLYAIDGQQPATDIFEERDPAFFVSLGKTRSRAFVTIATGTHATREVHVIDQNEPQARPRCIAPRRDGHRYWLDHGPGRFWILTNDHHPNFRLVSASTEHPGEPHWREEIAAGDRDYLQHVSCFSEFMIVTGRIDGLTSLRLRDYDGRETPIAFAEPVCTARVGDNREFATDRVRLAYSSMITPPSVIDYVVATGEQIVRKVQEIPSGYDKSLYATDRVMATSRDGVEIPLTLVHRKDFPKDGSGKLFLYGYGAYGMGMEPHFSASRLSLLDRGFCFAIAHVRGGDELGQLWYEAAKREHKPRTFSDFIAVAEHLVERGYARAGNIAIKGGSAGGMLIGAVLNRRPELWRCAIADVPFVDVLNTMLDDSLPLTPIEWPEWGNPIEDEAAFKLLLGYSPYETIQQQHYPPTFVTAGISDPRVTYWEPAKFTAKLRALKTDDHSLFLKTNMDAGHFGASGRYDSLMELAEQYAFVLRCFEQGHG